jgi:hypothetical protein
MPANTEAEVMMVTVTAVNGLPCSVGLPIDGVGEAVA